MPKPSNQPASDATESFDVPAPLRIQDAPGFPERRRFRRHELLGPQVVVERWDPASGTSAPIGEILDLSAGGVRIRTGDPTIAPGMSIQIRLRLPSHAGICPFISYDGQALAPSCEWTGRFSVLRRLEREDGTIDLGGRLLGMDASTRGMLGLYLSIQPLAA